MDRLNCSAIYCYGYGKLLLASVEGLLRMVAIFGAREQSPWVANTDLITVIHRPVITAAIHFICNYTDPLSLDY